MPVKSIESCERLFFLHMRKAGGTSLRALLGEAAQRQGLDFDAQEGGVLDFARLGGRNTFSVTCLREPVDRICSLYNFMGRWPHDVVPKTSETARPFAEWLDARPRRPTPLLWDESADYYTKTLGGGSIAARGLGSDAECFERARRALQRFDMVLVFERFGQPDYDAWWRRRLALDADTKLPHRMRTIRRQSVYDIRDHLTDDLRANLAARNRWDSRLYRQICRQAQLPLFGD